MAETTTQSITQDELSQILHGNVESVLTPPEDIVENTEEVEEKVEEPAKFKQPVNTDFKWTELEADEEEKEEVKEEVKVEEGLAPVKKVKTSTKPDTLAIINELIEEGELLGYEDGPVKSVDEIKDLLKLNIQNAKKSSFEEIWKEKVESFSPQVQAILKYAENGGEDIAPLLNAISQIEEVESFDVDTEDGQEAIIREFLKVQGWSEDDIKDEIETAKDIDKLKAKAERFLPKLNQMHQERVEAMMREQEETDKQTEIARQNYLTTIRNTLQKEKLADVKLSRQDKALLWDGLTDVKYKSWSGQPTNKFFKKLEEIQAGQTADYDHFLEVVHMTLDPVGYKKLLKEQIKTESAVETTRQLKLDQRRNSNSETLFEEETKKPAFKRTGFKNPFA